MKKYIIVVLCLIVLATGIYKVDKAKTNAIATANSDKTKRTVILDAGHGGEDGGAVAFDGTNEKDINLIISNNVGMFFDLFGINYIPVRTDDRSVCDDGLDTVRKRKYSDIINRAALVNSVENSIFLSIHQNMYSQEKYAGTQVFFSKNTEDSEEFARILQNSVVKSLQPENTRTIKASDNNIYLLYNAKTTSVLVECGFLSNKTELQKLKSGDYQMQMAYCIFKGTLSFLNDKKDV